MLLDNALQNIQRRSKRENTAIRSALDRGTDYSLMELINARMAQPFRSVNSKAIDAVSAANETCRQSSGKVADGTWIPFHALAQARDLTVSGHSALVSGKVNETLEEALRPASAIVGAGATVMSGVLAGNLILPKIVGQALTGNWLSSEGATYAQADPSFEQTIVVPNTLSIEIRISRRLLMNSAVDLESGLRQHILSAFMAEIDRVALVGSSASNQPEGLLTLSTVPVVSAGTNGAAPTWQHLVDLEYQVAASNGRVASGAFITNAEVQRKLRVTQRAAGLDFILGADSRVLAYPTRISSHVPSNLTKGTSSGICSALLFGDFSELVVAFWGPAAVDLIVDGYTMAKDGLVRVIARADVGLAPRNIGAFAVMKDLLTS